MGSFVSSLAGYQNVWFMMDTGKTLDMHASMRTQFAQIGAYHEQKALEQQVIAGAVGGGGPFYNQGSYGNQAGFWLAMASYVKSMSVIFVPLLLVIAIISWLAGLTLVLFITLFGALFFAFYALQYSFTSGRLWVSSYKPFVYSLVSSLLLASVVTIISVA